MAGAITFIHKDGRIIPINAAEGAGRAASAAKTAYKGAKTYVAQKKQKYVSARVKPGFNALGLGLSVASGIVGAATFSGSKKIFAGGLAASHALDIAGTAANVLSTTGHGFKSQRTKQIAKQEARNFVVGNAVYAAGLFGLKKNREEAVRIASKGIKYAKKVITNPAFAIVGKMAE